MKWSGTQIPSQPVASACWQPSSSSAHVWPEFAQYENLMACNLTVGADPSSGRYSFGLRRETDTGFDPDSLAIHAVVGNTFGDLAIMEAKLKHGRS